MGKRTLRLIKEIWMTQAMLLNSKYGEELEVNPTQTPSNCQGAYAI